MNHYGTLAFAIVFASFASATPPVQLIWSNLTYGPDGPWHAVRVSVGQPPQQIDLIPAGDYHLRLIDQSVCQDVPASQPCYALKAGTYNKHLSTTEIGAVRPPVPIERILGSGKANFTYLDIADQLELGYAGESTPVANVSIELVESGTFTLPNGTQYPLTIGTFPLGGPNSTYFNGAVNTSITPYALLNDSVTVSSSYSMHIGSIDPEIGGSLCFGAYDRNRILGVAYGKPYQFYGSNTVDTPRPFDDTRPRFPLYLRDIAIETAPGRGPSPFSSMSIPGLLASGNASIRGPIEVETDSGQSMLLLPRTTCDAIADQLPVIFHPELGTYLWDTESSMYTTIVRSPSYLSFTFDDDTNAGIITVNVPFMLLNLTLSEPILNTPTPYFPCSPYDGDPKTGDFYLGRAFLQAAFVAVNWKVVADPPGLFFLAQAPGPNAISEPDLQTLLPEGTSISGLSTDWASTWDGVWEPLPSSDSSTSTTIGVSVGVGLGVILIVAALGFVYLRKRRRNRVMNDETHNGAAKIENHSSSESMVRSAANDRLPELEESKPQAEMDGDAVRCEMNVDEDDKGPREGGRLNPAELDAGAVELSELPTALQRTPIENLSPANEVTPTILGPSQAASSNSEATNAEPETDGPHSEEERESVLRKHNETV